MPPLTPVNSNENERVIMSWDEVKGIVGKELDFSSFTACISTYLFTNSFIAIYHEKNPGMYSFFSFNK